jgi:hypothetical protein
MSSSSALICVDVVPDSTHGSGDNEASAVYRELNVSFERRVRELSVGVRSRGISKRPFGDVDFLFSLNLSFGRAVVVKVDRDRVQRRPIGRGGPSPRSHWFSTPTMFALEQQV